MTTSGAGRCAVSPQDRCRTAPAFLWLPPSPPLSYSPPPSSRRALPSLLRLKHSSRPMLFSPSPRQPTNHVLFTPPPVHTSPVHSRPTMSCTATTLPSSRATRCSRRRSSTPPQTNYSVRNYELIKQLGVRVRRRKHKGRGGGEGRPGPAHARRMRRPARAGGRAGDGAVSSQYQLLVIID